MLAEAPRGFVAGVIGTVAIIALFVGGGLLAAVVMGCGERGGGDLVHVACPSDRAALFTLPSTPQEPRGYAVIFDCDSALKAQRADEASR